MSWYLLIGGTGYPEVNDGVGKSLTRLLSHLKHADKDLMILWTGEFGSDHAGFIDWLCRSTGVDDPQTKVKTLGRASWVAQTAGPSAKDHQVITCENGTKIGMAAKQNFLWEPGDEGRRRLVPSVPTVLGEPVHILVHNNTDVEGIEIADDENKTILLNPGVLSPEIRGLLDGNAAASFMLLTFGESKEASLYTYRLPSGTGGPAEEMDVSETVLQINGC